MPSFKRIKSSFTAGELAPELLGRGDLRAYENGARRLRNVVIQATGGVARRAGLRHVAILPGAARLIAFEFNTEQTYLLVLTASRMQVFLNDAEVASVTGPWTEAMLPQLAFTQNADTLILLHPDMPPQRITRSGHTAWTVQGFGFSRLPWARFAPTDIEISTDGTSGSVTVTASAAVFRPEHVGALLRMAGKQMVITGYTNPVLVTATVQDTLTDSAATTDWHESAFSAAHGWPTTACFHQDRLVLGGSRDLPNRLWLSRSGDLTDFDLGNGLDDQGIEFSLLSDQVNAIRGVFSGRHLQVFTSGAEWMVSGDPLTPSSMQLTRQTRMGSPIDRIVPPVDVDGSTVFVARSNRAVHEFAYTDVQQAYQANDLALVAKHLVATPMSMAYDQTTRLLHIVMLDGSMATLTLFRTEQVTAWTRQDTAGAFRAVAELDGAVYVTVERFGSLRLERFDATLAADAALHGASGVAQDSWSGLAHLEGQVVTVLADGAPRGTATVVGGAVAVDPPATSVQAGLAFLHEVEPLPPEAATPVGARTGPLRLVAATFRLLETAALEVDLGRGLQPVPFRRMDTPMLDAAPPRFTGDISLRAFGWHRTLAEPLWRIVGETPLPFTLLSVTTEIRMPD
ncbi:hypothetical protein ACQW02_00590 [Humitalea sp. 24SJ18S-53]|uniref:hypothetical protein n=1 Tax=Humitalea sp. 24SJ18S-53 TaxID=3422307 RepID=UPI003D66ACD0